ncbi:MAG: TilS substrate-binding domain-containing protein, partial [Nocardioidaceae bacterium]|nr:TilS substrate-binding domain-containing protein [Nocardioidaceae bacterium]
ADLLDELARGLAATAATPDGGWDVRALLAAPAALRSRVLRGAALSAGCPPTDLTAGHLGAIASLLEDWHGQAALDLPGSVRAWRSATTLHLEAAGVTG